MNKPVTINGHELVLYASIGFAVFPQHGDNSADLMRAADCAMYKAKRGGVSYDVYDNYVAHQKIHHFDLMKDLEKALVEGALQLNYQPIVYMGSGKVHSVEPLIRWQHAVRGYIEPDFFIPMAERKGLIKQLSRWVVNEACLQVALAGTGFGLGSRGKLVVAGFLRS